MEITNSAHHQHAEDYLSKLSAALQAMDKDALGRFIRLINESIGTERTVFIAGNGGSAATSSHMACDLGKTILGKSPRENRRRLRTISLNDSIPAITAWANDEAYDFVFAEQLKSLGKAGDILIIITGSGNSRNILEAAQAARELGVHTFGLLGFGGGKVRPMLDDCLLIDSHDYGVVEDAHSIVNHLVTDWFKQRVGGGEREAKAAFPLTAVAGFVER